MRAKVALLLLGLVLAGQAMAGAVVVGRDVPVPALDAEQVRRIFLGRQVGINGQPVTVVYQKSGALRERFEAQVLRKTPTELEIHWTRLIFTGRAYAPGVLANDAEVKATVNRLQGAFGYISDDAVDDSVKVVFRF